MIRSRIVPFCTQIVLGLLLVATLLLPPIYPVRAQGTDLTVVIDSVDTANFPTVEAHVSVRNRNGVPVSGLTSEHFEIIEDGEKTFQPSAVETESNPDAQVSLGIVIDMYRTLEGEPIKAAQEATKELLTELLDQPGDADRAAFIGVHQDMSTDPATIDEEYEVAFTNDRNKLLNVINFLHERIEREGPGTPLYDAVIKAIRMAEATEPIGRRAVIVMTDGEDRGSVSADSDTIQRAANARIPVFTIGLSNSGLDEQYLRRLAENTGGTYQAAETPDDFSALFSNILTTLRTQYVLTYDATLPEDGQPHSLLVRVKTPTQLEGYGEYRVETPGESAVGSETSVPDATPSPSNTATPTPEASQDIQSWVQDNMLLAILGVAALGLAFLAIIIVVIIIVRRRGQAEEPEIPPMPQAPPPSPPPDQERAPPAHAGVTEAEAEAPSGPAPTAREGAPAFGTAPSPPPSEPPAFAWPDAQPPAPPEAEHGGTQVMDRTPKMSRVGLLIDRKRPDHRFDVAKPTVTIGRASTNDVTIDHNTVSRQHAAIKLEEDQFRLYDMGSTNGTFLGEQRVRAPVELKDGAIVRFGDTEFIFKIVALDTGKV